MNIAEVNASINTKIACKDTKASWLSEGSDARLLMKVPLNFIKCAGA